MTNRKFFKTTFTVEVLSEDTPISDGVSLSDLTYNITEGDCSGEVKRVSVEQLDGKQAADALMQQRSDPEFFQIDENGNDLE